MPTASIVIPTYNRAHLLGEALASLLAQTYGDWEALIVDDGSTDHTAEVVASLADARIRYLYQNHGERSAARNRGLTEALGDYIAFLDDDDLYEAHALESEICFLDDHAEIDVICGGTRVVDAEGRKELVVRPWETRPPPTILNIALGLVQFPMCSVMFRRTALSRLDHWFDPALNLAEDADFFARLAIGGCRFAWLPRVVSTYRIIHTDRSLHVLLDFGRGYRAMLDKLFARPDLPAEVRARRKEAYIRLRLSCACTAYAYGAVNLAQRELLQAVILEPDLQSPLLLDIFRASVLRTARHHWAVEDAHEYVEYVLAHLPGALKPWQYLGQELLAEMRVTATAPEP
ncbi:MAG: glycosyltransferase [Chloroflexi bacterium]|nr:glycosyltransferase [Chloroflexota bacterium]